MVFVLGEWRAGHIVSMQGINFVFRAIFHKICSEAASKTWMSKWHIHWHQRHSALDHSGKQFAWGFVPFNMLFQKHLRFCQAAKSGFMCSVYVHCTVCTHVHHQLTFLHKTIKYENKSKQLHIDGALNANFTRHLFLTNERNCMTKSRRDFGSRFSFLLCSALFYCCWIGRLAVYCCFSSFLFFFFWSKPVKCSWLWMHIVNSSTDFETIKTWALVGSLVRARSHTYRKEKTKTEKPKRWNASTVCWRKRGNGMEYTTITRPENRSK